MKEGHQLLKERNGYLTERNGHLEEYQGYLKESYDRLKEKFNRSKDKTGRLKEENRDLKEQNSNLTTENGRLEEENVALKTKRCVQTNTASNKKLPGGTSGGGIAKAPKKQAKLKAAITTAIDLYSKMSEVAFHRGLESGTPLPQISDQVIGQTDQTKKAINSSYNMVKNCQEWFDQSRQPGQQLKSGKLVNKMKAIQQEVQKLLGGSA